MTPEEEAREIAAILWARDPDVNMIEKALLSFGQKRFEEGVKAAVDLVTIVHQERWLLEKLRELLPKEKGE